MEEEKQNKVRLYNKIYGGYINVDSTEKTVANYTKLAADYENDFVGLGYETPKVVAQSANEFLKGDNLQVLDIACGTGLVAEGLRSDGFKGAIDGIDGSSGMLEIAKKKDGLYRNLVDAFVTPETDLAFSSDTYDAVVCSGGYGPGHLMPPTLSHLIRVTKRNGIIVFATRDNKQASGYVKELSDEIQRLESEKIWAKEKVFQTNYFNFDNSASDKDSTPLYALIYCYKKL